MSAPLWTPSAERVAAANITAFARSVEQQWGVAAPDYQSLYNFSLTRPEAFWKSFWTFTNVRGTMGERVVADFDRMPGARFFPDARLNFAENLLRRTDDRPAILFRSENGTDRSISARELYLAVGRFASALRREGRRRRRPCRRVHPEYSRGRGRRARHRGGRRRLVVLVTRLRRAGRG